MAGVDALYLFTSNMRPLYEQDAIDVLAAPSATRYRFRYQSQYLGTGLLDDWVANALVGLPVVVCFSIQQEANYHASAFIPVRFGKVISTREEGSLHIVEFEIGDHASLALDHDRMGQLVQEFSKQLTKLLGETPDRKKSAVRGPKPTELLTGDETRPSVWEHAVEYLSKTLSFRQSVFIRFSGLHEVGLSDPIEFKDGVALLTAGRTYELRVTHLQTRDANVIRRYEISVDGQILSIVGSTEFEIASRYDTVPITLHAQARDDVRETTLTVSPAQGVAGATLRLRIRVSPDKGRQVVGAIGTATALLLIALPGMLPDTAPLWSRVVPAFSGSLLGASLAAARLKRT